MSDDLRERLRALAAEWPMPSLSSPVWEARDTSLAIAAYRMAIEDAALVCEAKAQHDYANIPVDGAVVPRMSMGNRCDDCADDVRALADDL